MLRRNVSGGTCGFPDISFHGEKPWRGQFAAHERYVGVMFAGREEGKEPDIVYVASNSYWEEIAVLLPELPETMTWELAADTWEASRQEGGSLKDNRFRIHPRTVMVWVGKKV